MPPDITTEKLFFKVEWYNPESEVTKEFLLTFYTTDNSLQLFDLKNRRPFLRRMQVPNISLKMLQKNAKINLLSRLMRVIDYGDTQTHCHFEKSYKRLFMIVKPNKMNKVGKIIKFLEDEGFTFSDMKISIMGEKMAKLIFHQESQNMHSLVQAVAEVPCLAISAFISSDHALWMDEHEINQTDELTDSEEEVLNGLEMLRQCGFLRTRKEDQEKAAALWFAKEQKSSVHPHIEHSMSTCCLIKPHAIREKNFGNIIELILSSGFRLTGLLMMTLSREHIYEFLKHYIGVILDQTTVDELISGPAVALEVIYLNDPTESVPHFRELVGFINPDLGSKTQPNTIRAKYGLTLPLNAVHCTDLSCNAERELNYLFNIWPKYD